MVERVQDIVTAEQIAALEANGWAIVHREPTEKMERAFFGRRFAQQFHFAEGYHRVVATSIRIWTSRTD